MHVNWVSISCNAARHPCHSDCILHFRQQRLRHRIELFAYPFSKLQFSACMDRTHQIRPPFNLFRLRNGERWTQNTFLVREYLYGVHNFDFLNKKQTLSGWTQMRIHREEVIFTTDFSPKEIRSVVFCFRFSFLLRLYLRPRPQSTYTLIESHVNRIWYRTQAKCAFAQYPLRFQWTKRMSAIANDMVCGAVMGEGASCTRLRYVRQSI